MNTNNIQNHSPLMVILAGPNGSGKTTLRRAMEVSEFGYMPKIFINADDIKIEENISNIEAQKEAINRINLCFQNRESFIFETVFSHISKLLLIQNAKMLGYKVKVIFVLTNNTNINIRRVDKRFKLGGHDVPTDKIINRYYRSLDFVKKIYQVADKLYIIDNSDDEYGHELIFKNSAETLLLPTDNWTLKEILKLVFGIDDVGTFNWNVYET